MVAFMHTGTRLTAGYRYTTLGDATDLARVALVAKTVPTSFLNIENANKNAYIDLCRLGSAQSR